MAEENPKLNKFQGYGRGGDDNVFRLLLMLVPLLPLLEGKGMSCSKTHPPNSTPWRAIQSKPASWVKFFPSNVWAKIWEQPLTSRQEHVHRLTQHFETPIGQSSSILGDNHCK